MPIKPLSEEAKRLIVYPLAIRKIGLEKSWRLRGVGNKALFSEQEKEDGADLREIKRLWRGATNYKDYAHLVRYAGKASLERLITLLLPWLNPKRAQAEIYDYCPRCTYPSRITPDSPNIPVQEAKGEWRCAHCGARREWNRAKAQKQIWALYKSWLLGINTFKMPRALLALYTRVAHCLARSLAWIAPIRFCEHMTSRIGHFVLDTAMTALHKEEGMYPEGLDIPGYTIHENKLSNAYLLDKWLARFEHSPIAGRLPHFCFYPTLAPIYTEYRIEILLHDPKPILTFTEDENKYAWEYLKKIGVPEGSKFITLLCRDAAYLKMAFSNIDYSHHSYRDVDIDTYRAACKYLAAKGYYIIRMGAKQEKKINWASDHIIDYAFEHRSEFMDLWLFSNCIFGITSGSGPDHICSLAKRPLLVTNTFPSGIRLYAGNQKCIQLFKHFIKNEKEIPLAEVLQTKDCYSSRTIEFAEAGFTIKDNSPEELLEAVSEMLLLLNGQYTLSPEEKLQQKKLWQIASKHSIGWRGNWPAHVPCPYHGFFARLHTSDKANNR